MRRSMGNLSALTKSTEARLSEVGRTHQDFLLLLILFVSLRLSLMLIARPQGYLLDASDYNFYLQLGQLSDRGLYPGLHYWTEYPPIFPWIAVAAYKAVEAVPTLQGDPILWIRLALGSVLLIFDVGNLVLIYWLDRTLHGAAGGLRSAWIYALLFTPLHVWLGWFDTMPLFFLLLALVLTVRGRSSSAAAVAGLGFMVKVFPILTLSPLLKGERGLLQRARLVALAGLAVGLVAAPFLALAPQYLVASFRSMTDRSPWETVWAIAEGYYGYGWVASLTDRVDPSTASYTAYTSHLPWPVISVGFAVLYLLLWTRPFDPRRPLNVVAFTGLTVNLFLFYSRGYSPQFLVYIVPFVLLTLPPFRAVAYLTVLSAINLLEFPVYMVLFKDQDWVMQDLVMMRAAILLILSWEYLTILGLVPSLDRARRLAVSGTMLAFAAWGVITLPGAGQEWVRYSQQHDPNAATIDYLTKNAGPQAVVVFTDQGLYRALYPYLYRRTHLLLVSPASDSRIASVSGAGGSTSVGDTNLSGQVERVSSSYGEIFGVRQLDDGRGRQVEYLLASQNRLDDNRRLNDLSVTRWTTNR